VRAFANGGVRGAKDAGEQVRLGSLLVTLRPQGSHDFPRYPPPPLGHVRETWLSLRHPRKSFASTCQRCAGVKGSLRMFVHHHGAAPPPVHLGPPRSTRVHTSAACMRPVPRVSLPSHAPSASVLKSSVKYVRTAVLRWTKVTWIITRAWPPTRAACRSRGGERVPARGDHLLPGNPGSGSPAHSRETEAGTRVMHWGSQRKRVREVSCLCACGMCSPSDTDSAMRVRRACFKQWGVASAKDRESRDPKGVTSPDAFDTPFEGRRGPRERGDAHAVPVVRARACA